MAESFVTAEEERSIFLNRTSQRAAKLIPFKGGNGTLIEKVPGVQRTIAQKLKHRTMQFIGPGLRDHSDLLARSLSIFGRVRIAHHIAFPDDVNAQQLP